MTRVFSSTETTATGPSPVATERAATSNAERKPVQALLTSNASHEPDSPTAAASRLAVAGTRSSPPVELTKTMRRSSRAERPAASSARRSAAAPTSAIRVPGSAQ